MEWKTLNPKPETENGTKSPRLTMQRPQSSKQALSPSLCGGASRVRGASLHKTVHTRRELACSRHQFRATNARKCHPGACTNLMNREFCAALQYAYSAFSARNSLAPQPLWLHLVPCLRAARAALSRMRCSMCTHMRTHAHTHSIRAEVLLHACKPPHRRMPGHGAFCTRGPARRGRACTSAVALGPITPSRNPLPITPRSRGPRALEGAPRPMSFVADHFMFTWDPCKPLPITPRSHVPRALEGAPRSARREASTVWCTPFRGAAAAPLPSMPAPQDRWGGGRQRRGAQCSFGITGIRIWISSCRPRPPFVPGIHRITGP